MFFLFDASSAIVGDVESKEPQKARELLQSLPNLPLQLEPVSQVKSFAALKGQVSEGARDFWQLDDLAMNLVPELQRGLGDFIQKNGNHIAAVVMVEVATGRVLAMSQGRNPESWQSDLHSAVYAGFPAASVFKTVSTAAAIEVGGMEESDEISLNGGCGHIYPGAAWLMDTVKRQQHRMTLGRAFASSCNHFYAKLALRHVGLTNLNQFADRFKFGKAVPADFRVPISPVFAPTADSASVATVGRYAAGFGAVGMSAAHAAWIYTAIARDGLSTPLRLFTDLNQTAKGVLGSSNSERGSEDQIMKPSTSLKLRSMMASTARSGTASYAFRRKPYAPLRELVGGKTGTLTGELPLGLTTWFVGMMPIEKPEVVVAAVVVTDDRWVIKGPQLAAEAFLQYSKWKAAKPSVLATQGVPEVQP
jgi:peptidoglycan glycosyltransferase